MSRTFSSDQTPPVGLDGEFIIIPFVLEVILLIKYIIIVIHNSFSGYFLAKKELTYVNGT